MDELPRESLKSSVNFRGGVLRVLRQLTPSQSWEKVEFNFHQSPGRQWILPPPAPCPDCCDNFFQSCKCLEENILEKCDTSKIQNVKFQKLGLAGGIWNLFSMFQH